MKEIFVCKDPNGNILNIFESEKLAKESWTLSYSSLFLPVFKHRPATRWEVYSATDRLMGTIDTHFLRDKVEHL